MKFILDSNLSPLIADAIDILLAPDHHVTHVRRKFRRDDISDLQWIAALGAEGDWSVISADLGITRNAQERQAWRSARIKGLFLAPSGQAPTHLRRTALLLEWWPRLIAQAELIGSGAAFEVPLRPHAKLRQLRP